MNAIYNLVKKTIHKYAAHDALTCLSDFHEIKSPAPHVYKLPNTTILSKKYIRTVLS